MTWFMIQFEFEFRYNRSKYFHHNKLKTFIQILQYNQDLKMNLFSERILKKKI